jgi:hypothetical protein
MSRYVPSLYDCLCEIRLSAEHMREYVPASCLEGDIIGPLSDITYYANEAMTHCAAHDSGLSLKPVSVAAATVLQSTLIATLQRRMTEIQKACRENDPAHAARIAGDCALLLSMAGARDE